MSSALEIAGLEAAVVREAPPAGALSASPERLENDLVRVELAADGTLASVCDKRAAREVLDGRGNQLWAYVDKPRKWDAWDVEAGYAERGRRAAASGPLEVVESGPHRAAVRVERAFRDSRVVQDVRLWAGSARIDFATRLDWHDRRWLLKARFPLAVRSDRATFETAFGVVERPTHRNTSWDEARFEVAGHRFADLSEPGYGVALLNDGRYGHHALGSELGLSLLRSPIWPDPLADEGVQEVVYALYPHAGQWLEGGVLAEAEDLNRPLLVHPVTRRGSDAAAPARARRPAARARRAEAARGRRRAGAARLRAPGRPRHRAARRCPTAGRSTSATDLLERATGAPELGFGPFQVRTWRLCVRAQPGRHGTSHSATPDVSHATLQRGSIKRKALPPPSAGSAQIRPPWASTIRRQTASPIPAPSVCWLSRVNISKIRLAFVRVDAEAVVAHGQDPLLAVALSGGELDARRRLAAVLHGVAEQILQHPAELPRVGHDLGQLADLERRAGALRARVQILGHLGHQLPEGDALGAQLPGAGVEQHAVDELARAVAAHPELPQHVRRTAAPRRAAEQPDQQRDARDRLVQVVRHDVGEAP